MKRAQLAEWSAIGCRWAVLATIVVAPIQWDIFQAWGGHLTLVDPLILLAAVCWLVRVLAAGEWGRVTRALPWQVTVFVLPAVLSIFMVKSEGIGDALRETACLVEYFVLGYLLYDDLLRQQPRRLRTVAYLVLGVMVAMVSLAMVQFFTQGDPVHHVAGTFSSRNLLGGWLAMLLPVVFGVALYASNLWLRAGLVLLVLCGLLVNLAAASLGAVLVVMLLIAATRGWRTFVLTALAATCWIALVTGHVGRFPDPEHPDAEAHQTSQQVLFRSVSFYSPEGQPDPRYGQWQSALEMMLTHPWLGVGIGNYQRRLEPAPRPSPTRPSASAMQNLYLEIGSTLGLPALFGFLAVLLVPAGLAGAAAPRHAGWRKGFVYGVAGGIAALAITAIWHPMSMRGIGLHLVLLLVVARLLAEWSVDQSPSEATAGEARGASRQHRRRWRSPEEVPTRRARESGRR